MMANGGSGLPGPPLNEIGGEAVQTDFSNHEALDNLKIEANIVVNSAGLQHVAPIEDFPPERFSLMLQIMLEAPFRIARAALPGMYEKGWGRVINISSVHGLRVSPFKAACVAAKHGLEGLSKVLAFEGGPTGVTSNCVCPAFVRTPLVESQISDQARNQGIPENEVVEKIMLAVPRPNGSSNQKRSPSFVPSSASTRHLLSTARTCPWMADGQPEPRWLSQLGERRSRTLLRASHRFAGERGRSRRGP